MFIEIIGWSGTVLILLAYFLVSTKKIEPNQKLYQLLNLLGAGGVIINSAVHHAIPSVGLNTIWLIIALYSLITALPKPRNLVRVMKAKQGFKLPGKLIVKRLKAYQKKP